MKATSHLRLSLACSGSCLLTVSSALAASGDWISTSGGNWSDATRWSSNPTVPGTSAGDVIGITGNIAANSSVTVDTTARTAGILNIGDSNNSHGFTVNASGGGTLTFDNSGGGAQINEVGTVIDTVSAPIILADNLTASAGGLLVLSGNISETGGAKTLTKTGAGAVSIVGTNSYTGGSSVTAGTLSFRTVAAKSATGTHAFAAGTVLGLGIGAGGFTAADVQNAFAGSFTGNLAGISIGASNNISIDTTSGAATLSANIGPSTRGLEKIFGGSNLTVTGANEYSGRTVVNGGSGFIANSLGNIGDASSNVGTNSTIDLMANSFFQVGTSTTVSSDKTLNVKGSTVFFANGTGTAALIHSGSITSDTAGAKTFDLRSGATNFNANEISGVISDGSGTMNLRKSNAGTWIVSGPNTHSGTTTVAAGTLILGNSLALQNSALDTATGTAGTASAGLKTNVTTLTLGGLTGNKNFAATGGVFTTTAGGYDAVTALTLNPGSGANHSYSGVIANGAADMTLTKTGAGTQVIAGANTYSGDTTVSAGTLLVNGSTHVASDFAVNAGTLGGTGAIGGGISVSTGAILAPGASIESLSAASLNMASASSFAYEIADNSATGADLLAVGGTVSLAGVNLSLDVASLAALGGGGWTLGNKLTLISYSGADITSGFSGYSDNTSYPFGPNQWFFDYNDTVAGGNFGADAIASGQNRFVTLTIVPEPSSAALIGLAGLALLRRRRR